MAQENKHLIVIAGEASGDMHAAHLIQEIKRLDPQITFSGLGGPQMQAQGLELYQDLTKIAVVGFVEVIRHYPEIKKAFHLILHKVKERHPLAVILVDYPGFNLRLARELKKRNVKVIYYISPQVWAWKADRVLLIKKYIDKMLVLFQFEKDFYARFNINADFVGHPLIDIIDVRTSREEFLKRHGLQHSKLTIGILPGSRQKEIQTLLPLMAKAAAILRREFPQIQFLIVKAPTIDPSLIKRYCPNLPERWKIIEQQPYEAVHACDLVMVASGTATLETAILQKPMVIIYKTSLFSWLLAKLFVKIPDIGLVNIVAGKRIVPECLQFEATGPKIADELKNIFTNEPKIADMKFNLKRVKELLGPAGASRRAAEKILGAVST